MAQAQARALLVTDFDGTLTRHDFYHIVVEKFAPAGVTEHWEGYQSGRLTHFEALQAIFGALRASEPEVLAALKLTSPEPDLAHWIRALDAQGWDVVVASAGCEWYIRRVLAACGVDLPVHANPGTFSPEQGLRFELPLHSPYFSPTLGIDKAAIVRDALRQRRAVAFAGDGYPDLEAARLVVPSLRFARADLARALTREDLPFIHFERWSEVAQALCVLRTRAPGD